jgi:transcriptional regulator of acetoin/glycerol metabolism
MRISPARIRSELLQHDGLIAPVARALRIDYKVLRLEMKRLGLFGLVDELRSERHERERKRLTSLLAQHQGNLSAVARACRVSASTLQARVEQFGLREFARWLRPSRPPPSDERQRILDAIRRHRGHVGRVQEELGISKGTLRARMRRYDLFGEADALRIEANLSGPRTRLPRGRNRAERRAKLVAMLYASDWRVVRASRLAGVSMGTFYTMMRDLGIERPEAALRRQRLHRLVDALRLSRGKLAGAARTLGVTDYRTVARWCSEFEIDPRDFRS